MGDQSSAIPRSTPSPGLVLRLARSFRPHVGFAALLSILFLTFLDNTVISAVLANVQSELHSGVSQLQWVVGGYALAFASLMLICGSLGDNFGRKKVMLIGNGGSAAIVSHMHNDLCMSVGVRAVVFHELPLLTALTNDHGYECVFARPLELWADPGDVLFAFSSGGRSTNILGAVRAALARDCQVITLSGFKPDNPLRGMGLLNFYVPSQSYGYVETAHSALAHFLTDSAALSLDTGGRHG